jgi:hypothetical protein
VVCTVAGRFFVVAVCVVAVCFGALRAGTACVAVWAGTVVWVIADGVVVGVVIVGVVIVMVMDPVSMTSVSTALAGSMDVAAGTNSPGVVGVGAPHAVRAPALSSAPASRPSELNSIRRDGTDERAMEISETEGM